MSEPAPPLDSVRAVRPHTRRRLAPALHVCDATLWNRFEPLPVPADIAASNAERLVREGYFHAEPIAWELPIREMADAVTRLREARIPLAFSLVYDEFWLAIRRLDGLIGAILGSGYRMLPYVMAWHVDPTRGDSGWAPHRDRGRAAMNPDGTPRILTLWRPLTDATPANGCIYVVPADRDPTYNTDHESSLQFRLTDVRALPAAAGSVLGWTQSLIHWGARTADREEGARISFGCEFQPASVAPFGSPLLDPSLMPDLPTRLDAIGQSMLRHGHHAKPDPAVTALATALLTVPSATA